MSRAEQLELNSAQFSLSSASLQSKKSRGFVRHRERASLTAKPIIEEDEGQTRNEVNVLSTTTEASMSSTSFAIPRRSTIDADVSFFFDVVLSIHVHSFLLGQTTQSDHCCS